MADPEFACRCGAFHMRLPGGDASSGVRTTCYCKDCRAFARFTEADDRLNAGGGADIFITRPDRIQITRGAEHLRCLRLTPKGLERWYVACCCSPVTSHVPGWARMAGIIAATAQNPDTLGPERAVYCAKEASVPAKAPTADRGVKRLMLRVLAWSLAALATGANRGDPFQKDGGPTVKPTVLSDSDRAALYDG